MIKNKILSIQSKLIYGYVGSNIAEMAIQLHGLDVISFPTVLLSTHTGHKPIYGKAISKALFDELIEGIEAIDIINSTACIISGYIGTEEILLSSSAFIQRIKSKYPDKPYICDPVMGDMDEGLYIPLNVAENIIGHLIPQADILTPNHFELEYILQKKVRVIDDLIAYVRNNPLLKTKTLIVTSCNLEDTPNDMVETIVVEPNNINRVHSPKVKVDTTGTGDIFTALLASQLAKGIDIVSAATEASHTISDILDDMIQSGRDEMNAACILKHVRH